MDSFKVFFIVFISILTALVSYNEYKIYRNQGLIELYSKQHEKLLDDKLNASLRELYHYNNSLKFSSTEVVKEEVEKTIKTAILTSNFRKQFIQFVQGDPNKSYTSGKELMDNWESGIERQCGYWKRQVQIRDSDYNLAMRAKYCD